MDTTFDFTTAEVKEDTEMPETPKCRVDDCSNPVAPYGGKGPRPKVCVEHKRKAPTSTRARKAKNEPDYREALSGLLQLPAGVLAIVGGQTDKYGRLTHPELLADAAVIEAYTPPIVEAVNDLALQRPEVAAVLDRIVKVGPYGAIIAAVVPMAMQLLANHNVVPAGVAGTKSVSDILGVSTQPVEESPDAG